jgi:hypothetical protein
MSERIYYVLASDSRAGLDNLADANGLKLDQKTVKQFLELETDTDGTLGDVGRASSPDPGWVGLAWK